MINLLSEYKNPDVIQSVGRVVNAEPGKLDSLIVVTPHKISAQQWCQNSDTGAMRTIARRSKDTEQVFTRLPKQRAIGIWL